jgi:release factor glutamine methyltransferase
MIEPVMTEPADRILATIGRWLGLDPGAISPGARLGEELAVDPLDMVEVLFQLELALGVVLPLDRSWQGMTPGQVAALAARCHNALIVPAERADIQPRLEAAGCQYPREYAALLAPLPGSRLPEAVRLACQQVPVPVITGTSPILGLRLQVNDRVLTPGPETAVLARAALVLLDSFTGHPRVLEIGIGSGVVSIFLARNGPRARVIGTDISRQALDVARLNAALNGVGRSVRMIQHDCRRPLLREASVDLVVSNPPFLSEQEIRALPPLWRESTPATAIDGGTDGYELLRCVERQARNCLRDGGWLAIQYSAGQGDQVAALLREQSGWADLRALCWQDKKSCVTVARRCRP